MTACRNKASRAVTAALVGVLSVGAVPMVALAAGTTDTGAGIMASDAANAFSNGTVNLTDIGAADSDGKGGYTVSYSGGAIKPVAVSVTPRGEADPVVVVASNDYRVYYVKADEEGEPGTEKVPAIVDAGTYYVVVEAVSGDYAGGKVSVKFTVTGLNLGIVSAYDEDDNVATNVSYDAEPVDLTFKSGSTTLREGVDYTVRYFKGGEDVNNPSLGSETAPTDAGKYSAVITGAGAYAGSKDAKVDFEIKPLDLSKVTNVYVPTVVGEKTALPTAPTTVNGSEALASKLKLAYDQSTAVGECREYKPNVVPATENDPNFVKGTKAKADFYKVVTGVTFTYDGAALPETLTVNKGDKEGFNAWGDVTAEWVDANGEKQTKVMRQADCTIEDAKGNDITADLVAGNAGTYYITYTLVDTANSYYGGSAQIKLVVIEDAIDCTDSLYVTYKGSVVSSIEKDYDGKGLRADVTVALYNGDTKLTSGYTWHFEDAEGNELSDVKDAGEYKIVVTSDQYELTNATVDVTINKADVQALRIPTADEKNPSADTNIGDKLEAIDGQYAIAYKNGTPIAPGIEYTTGERDNDGDLVWHVLSGSDVEAVTSLAYTKGGEPVNVVKEMGDYVATLTLLGTDAAKNYELSAEPYEFTVADADLTFVDVTRDMYYFGSIEQAYENGYVKGYNNGKLYGPTDSMSRADVAVVLYRMSGQKLTADEGGYSELEGWDTGYVDCDNNAYYAEAVAWARKAGVVAGLDSEHFGPTQKVTREQFATMLANYAKATGKFEAADESVLDKYADAGQVSAFAKGTVAWAVENGVMGGSANLMPTNEITRADVAVMAVNYQPAPMVAEDAE